MLRFPARPVPRSIALAACRLALVALAVAAGCGGPGHVEFARGQCVIDGSVATLPEVEARQARITERILSRQPLFIVVTVLVVALAGASHVEKLVVLLSTRQVSARGIGERLRAALERHRSSPVRYFAIVVGTLCLLVLSASCYVYLDAEKRASERALGLLQFCHLALRNGEQEALLSEQRRNLESIQSTAGSIHDLVDGLPPEEQRKAREIVNQMNTALGRQGRLLSDSLARAGAETQAVRANTEALAHGLDAVEAGVGSLKTLPGGIKDLSEQAKATRADLARLGDRAGAEEARLASLESAVKALAARPEPRCPACVCEVRERHAAAPDGGVAPAK